MNSQIWKFFVIIILNTLVVFNFTWKNKQATIQTYNQLSSREQAFPCDDANPERYYALRGNNYVLYNYFKATKRFYCDQSITYTTHADFTFLDNLLTLLQRWQGPVSVAVYAPGTDFDEALKRIQYLRECNGSSIVKELVTFHIFFDQTQLPTINIPTNPEELSVDCDILTSTLAFGSNNTYARSVKLLYPINVARNVARETATTHYVFPSDIELYPSPNLIPNFLEMIRRNDTALQRPAPKVFVIPVFELAANVLALPNTKHELIKMLKNRSAVSFHKFVCANCHRVPKSKEWMSTPFLTGLNVFYIGKRHKPFQHWEPFYIGTKSDPMYDERLSWNGRKDKMLQGFIQCLLDYEFHILDNAFLVHRPGIKRIGRGGSKNPAGATAKSKQTYLISKTIVPQLKQIYGTKPECFV